MTDHATQAAADCLVNIVWTDDTQAKLAHKAVAEALREERRKTLEEACKTLCGWCASQYERDDVPTQPQLVDHDIWFHGPEELGFECYASKIRALIEKEPTNG